MNSIMEQTQAI